MTARMDPHRVADVEDVTVARWVDTLVETHGTPVRSAYVERFWLPIIGPSSLVLLRRFASDLDTADEVHYRLPDLGAEVGLPGAGKARHGHTSPIVRTISRLCDFGCVTMHGDRLLVRTALGPLPAALVRRLPERLALAHTRLTHEQVG